MPTPRIDVLIPVYNGAATLRSALASIQQQTITDIRIIVVDDGSSDETPSLLSELARDDPRIEVLTQINAGIVGALNAGLSLCRAEFVARHDADDLADPDRFERQLAYLEANCDCVAVSSYAFHIDTEGRKLSTTATPGPPSLADPHAIPSREPYLMHPFLMFRRSAVDQIGGYRHVFLSEDTDLFWRMQEIGRLHNMPEMMGYYRVHAGSLTSSSIVNARVGALTSQLAAVSAMRRRRREPDLAFPSESLRRYRSAPTLEAMTEIGGETLTTSERDYLAVAVPAKLLEISSYRLVEPDLDDCRFARKAWRRFAPILAPAARKSLSELCSSTAVRLVRKGHGREAAMLVVPHLLPSAGLRLMYQLAIPSSLRTALRERRKRRGAAAQLATSCL